MPLPTLNFKSVADSLVGREEEQKVLTDALQVIIKQAANATTGPQVVSFIGDSGSGKTYLVERWFAQQQQNQQTPTVVFAKGKFGQKEANAYGALVEAVSGLMRQVRNVQKLREYLSIELDEDELKLLSDFIPSIKLLLKDFFSMDDGGHESDSSSWGSDSLTFTNPIERFSFVFGGFLDCLCQLLPPSVVLIDDVQWGDYNSIQLLKSILGNQQLSSLLLVLACRPDPKLEQEVMPELRTIVMGNNNRIWREVSVQELDLDSCNAIVSRLTELREEVTRDLTELCYQKTKGNPYFLLRFLESLERRGLLVYDMQKFQFSWNLEQLRAQTDLADNVAAIVAEGIQALDADIQHTLRIVSRLGFAFHVNDVAYVLEGMSRLKVEDVSFGPASDVVIEVSDKVLGSVKEHLRTAVEKDLVNQQTEAELFKFSHDQIIQSFRFMSSSLSEEKLNEENIVLGRVLLSLFRTQPRSNVWALFAGLNALKPCYSQLSPKCQSALVKHYCLAAQKSFKRSAFH